MKKHRFTTSELLLLSSFCGLLLGLLIFFPLAHLVFDSRVPMKFIDAWVIYAFIATFAGLGVTLCWATIKWRPNGGRVLLVGLGVLCLNGFTAGLWVRNRKLSDVISRMEGDTLMLLVPSVTFIILLTLALTRRHAKSESINTTEIRR